MAKIDKHPKPSAKHPKPSSGKDKAEDKKKKDEAKGADKPKRPALPGTWRADFEASDKDKDGKLAKSELKIPKAELKTFDVNGNGTVTKVEFHAGFRKANSLAGLDKDGDGSLNQDEMKKLRRFNDAEFDTDADGNVTEQEFLAGRVAENRARQQARRDQAFESLTAKDKKALKGFDTDGDGDISNAEYHAGRDQRRQEAISAKIAANYAKAGGKDGVLKADETYKSYDADADGNISTEEFDAGQRADRSTFWTSALTKGGPDKMVAKRLDLDALGLGINRVDDKSSPKDPMPDGPEGKATELVISSFNVLGSSHTGPGGNKPGYASGVERIRTAAQLLDKHNVDIVGFQEFQPDQVKAFQKIAGDKYGLYPGMKLGRGPNVNSIAWDKRKWDLVKADTIPIPYFNGHPVKMPIVRLRNKETGQEAYFTNFHNPASTKYHPGNEHSRDVATQKEIDLVNRLKKSGLPVFMTGDFNEREETYDKVTRGTDMSAANEGKNGKRPKNMGIDWIFGTDDVNFSHYKRDDGALVDKTSDHPMIVSHATIRKKKS